MPKCPFYQIIFLAFILLFLAEYLDPSAIGVRAGVPPQTMNPASADNNPSAGTASSVPHAMIWVASPAGEKHLPEAPYLSTYQSFPKQQFRKEIYHPPLLIS
jgi:hypothetical protein